MKCQQTKVVRYVPKVAKPGEVQVEIEIEDDTTDIETCDIEATWVTPDGKRMCEHHHREHRHHHEEYEEYTEPFPVS